MMNKQCGHCGSTDINDYEYQQEGGVVGVVYECRDCGAESVDGGDWQQ